MGKSELKMYAHYDDENTPLEMKRELEAAVKTGLFSPEAAHELKWFTYFVARPIGACGWEWVPTGIYMSASKTGYVTRYQASPVQKYCQEGRIQRVYYGGAYNIPLKAIVALAYRRLRWEANHEPFKDDFLTGEGEDYDLKEIAELKEKAGWDWTAAEAMAVLKEK